MTDQQQQALVARLAAAIDPDSPPGLGARTLAIAVLELVQNRSGLESMLLAKALDSLRESYPR